MLYVLFVVIAVAAAKKNTTDCPQNSSTNCVFNKKCLNAIDSNVTLHIPDPDNCHKFYKCAGGNACLLCCPLINSEGSKRLVYNPKLQVCDWPQNVPNPVGKCDDVNPAPQPPTPTESTKTPTESTPISTKSTPTSTEPTTTTKQEPGSRDFNQHSCKSSFHPRSNSRRLSNLGELVH